jgi:hypothetical protein
MKTYIWSVITTIVIVNVACICLYFLLNKQPIKPEQENASKGLRTQRDITALDIAGLYNIYCFKLRLPEDCRKTFRVRFYAQKGNDEPQLINNIFYTGSPKDALQKIIIAQLENGQIKLHFCGTDTYFSPGFNKERTRTAMSYNPEIQPNKIFYKIRISGNTNYGNDFYNLKENEYGFFYRIDLNTLTNK